MEGNIMKHRMAVPRCITPALGAAMIGASALAWSLPVHAQTPAIPPTAAETNPKTNGVMQGFPPSPDKIVRLGDGSSSRFPGTRWSFSHIRELVPTANVSRGEGPIAPFPTGAEHNLDDLAVTTLDGKSITFGQALALTYTDGILVLHEGALVYERYFGEGAADRPHLAFSATKSFVGTLAATLVAQTSGLLGYTVLLCPTSS
jgi:CubicO group peptidase (beta-lactamase class C family)